jgi:hypothetical protein
MEQDRWFQMMIISFGALTIVLFALVLFWR